MKNFCTTKPTVTVTTEITNGQELFAVHITAQAHIFLKLTQQENRPVKEWNR